MSATKNKVELQTELVEYGASGKINSIRRAPGCGSECVIEQRYDGFKMTSGTIDGKSFEIRYDDDGRMILDGNQNVQVEYNILGLPERIFDNSHEIRYIYDAGGRKLAMALNSSYTYYRNTLIYDGEGYIPAQIAHPEGFVSTSAGGGFFYNYHKKDHAGNVRVLLTAEGGKLNVKQRTNYYPFGLAHIYNNLNQNRWLYSGKELQDATIGSTGMLGWYDFGARMYNPLFGHWFAPDPAYQALNPYLFCGNAPMCYIDKDGQWFGWVFGAFAAFGAYMGGSAANDNWNLFKWDWSSGKTWGGFLGGAIQGGLDYISGYYGYQALAAAFIKNSFSVVGIALRSGPAILNATSVISTVASLINNFDNGMDILRGNYLYSSKTVAGKILQGTLRGTWERLQQTGGYIYSQGRNGLRKGFNVNYFHGATVINTTESSKHRGVTLGNMINGWNLQLYNNSMLYHEYGHTLQSRLAGPIYLPFIGIPSAIVSGNDNGYWTEVLANQLSYQYFGADTWNQTAGAQKDENGNAKYPLTY